MQEKHSFYQAGKYESMIELTKYETFLKIFSVKSAYKHVINRILPEIKALLPSNISLTMGLGVFTLPNYVDCARDGIKVQLEYNYHKFKYLDYMYNYTLQQNMGCFADPYQTLAYPHQKYIYIHACKSLEEFKNQVVSAANKLSVLIETLEKQADEYKFVMDAGYRTSDIINSYGEASNAYVYLSVCNVDDFIKLCKDNGVKVDDKYRDYVIEEFKVAADGVKVNADFSTWVHTPQVYNLAENKRERDNLIHKNEECAELLNRINGDN